MNALRSWTTRIMTALMVLTFITILSGCDDNEDHGSAPIISALIISPQIIPVGEQSPINGSVTFSDDDGDVAELMIDLDGTEMEPVVINGAEGMTDGTVNFTLLVPAPAARAYDVDFRIIDDEGNESNQLSDSFTAE